MKPVQVFSINKDDVQVYPMEYDIEHADMSFLRTQPYVSQQGNKNFLEDYINYTRTPIFEFYNLGGKRVTYINFTPDLDKFVNVLLDQKATSVELKISGYYQKKVSELSKQLDKVSFEKEILVEKDYQRRQSNLAKMDTDVKLVGCLLAGIFSLSGVFLL